MTMLPNDIPPPDRKKYLSVKQQEDWKNPFLLLNPDGTLTLIAGETSTRQTVKGEELESVLIGLPASDWSFGRVIAVQPSAIRSSEREQFEREDKALKQTWSRMRDTMTKLEVQVNLWPSA